MAYNALNNEEGGLGTIIETAKYSFLGLYFFVEMFTITNAMGITNYSWGAAVSHIEGQEDSPSK